MRAGTLLASFLIATTTFAQEWQIDTLHSAAQFSVRHLMVSTVRGQFGTLRGTAVFDPKNPSAARVKAEVDASTIDTRNPKRDEDLKGQEFFDVKKYPKLTFESTKVEKVADGKFRMTGNFTLRGVTKPVVFDVEGLSQVVKDERGERIGASATTKINRSDYGIMWNKVIEAGGVAVSDEVTILIDVELTRKPAPSN